MQAPRWPPDMRDWRLDLGRLAGGGLGSILALVSAEWPGNAAAAAWVGLGGALAGLCVWFGVEYVWSLRAEVHRLRDVERQLEAERQQMAAERKLRDHQLAVARAESAINAVCVEVWGGAFNEAAQTGHILPLEAILARKEALLKSKGLDKPLPPPS